VENYRLRHPPKANARHWREPIGADGMHLLHALEQAEAPADLSHVASVQMLQQVWQQYDDVSGGQAKWRAGPQESSDEGIIRSPSDPEARTGKKRETTWFGSKVHLTETCALEKAEDAQAQAMPQLIVEVQTTVAHVQDVDMTEVIQEDLAQHHRRPEEQIVDTGYIDAELLVKRKPRYGIKLVGPVLSDNRGPRQSEQRLRWIAFPDRLAEPASHLSARANQCSLESGWRAHGNRLCPRGLCRLSDAQRLHQVTNHGACVTCAPTSGECRLAGAATRTTNPGVSTAI
jgi:hypothetical protein